MIKKEFYKKQITVISNNLDFIFNNQILLKEIKEDKELRNAIESSLNILNTCESVNKTKKHINLAIKKYHEVSGTKFTPSILTYTEEYEYLDLINWLAVLCKNKYGIILNSKTRYEAKEILEVNPEQEKRDAIITGALGGEVNPASIMELNQKMQNASRRFQNDVKEGNIYIFSSKPKILPITKLLFIYSFALFSLASFALAIMYFVTSTQGFIDLDTHKTLGFMEGIFWIILSGFSIQMSVKNLTSWYRKKNDNVRYYFFWHVTLLFFILVSLFICNSVFVVDTSSSITIFSSWKAIINNTDSSYIKNCMYAMITIICIVIALFVISAILLIIAIACNPKRDEKKISDIYKEYMKDNNITA